MAEPDPKVLGGGSLLARPGSHARAGLDSGDDDGSAQSGASSRRESARPGTAAKASGVAAAPAGPLLKAGTVDVLQTLEPLQRFLNLGVPPKSLEEFASNLAGYRVTTLIALISDPSDSRLGYDFDMATEAILRRRIGGLHARPVPVSLARCQLVGIEPPAHPSRSSQSDTRHERQPGTILFRIDRQGSKPDQPAPPQELLLLLLVGETPTWGIHHEALTTSLNIAWSLDVQRNGDNARGAGVSYRRPHLLRYRRFPGAHASRLGCP